MAHKFGADPSGMPTAANIADNILSNFQGLFALQPMGKYVSGARTILKINGEIVAFAFQIGWNIRTEQDEIWTIDDWTPYELAPKRISIDGTIGGFYFPIKGSPTKNMMAPNVMSFMFHKYIDIEVKDSKTDALLFKTDRAVIVSNSVNITSENLAQVSLTWKAIGWADEKVPQYPDGVPTPTNNSKSKSPGIPNF